jgi:predicted DNA-binding protein
MEEKQWQTFSVRMPLALRQKLDELAKAQDRRPSDTVRRLIKLAHAELEQQSEPVTDDHPTPAGPQV